MRSTQLGYYVYVATHLSPFNKWETLTDTGNTSILDNQKNSFQLSTSISINLKNRRAFVDYVDIERPLEDTQWLASKTVADLITHKSVAIFYLMVLHSRMKPSPIPCNYNVFTGQYFIYYNAARPYIQQ